MGAGGSSYASASTSSSLSLSSSSSSIVRRLSRRISVVKERFEAHRARRRALKRLNLLRRWDTDFVLLASEVRESHALCNSQQQRIANFRKRLRKTQKKLRRTLTGEKSLNELLDNKEYLQDLRGRLVRAKEKCLASRHGLKPSDEVLEGLRALEDGNPFSKEYRNLEIEVEDMVERHKKSELDWLDEQIRKTTTWLKRIERLAKKMTACIEIGRGLQGAIQGIASNASDAAILSATGTKRLDTELVQVEGILGRIKSERLQIEAATAFAASLLTNGEALHQCTFDTLDLVDETQDADLSAPRKRWRKAIRLVIADLRQGKERKRQKALAALDRTARISMNDEPDERQLRSGLLRI